MATSRKDFNRFVQTGEGIQVVKKAKPVKPAKKTTKKTTKKR